MDRMAIFTSDAPSAIGCYSQAIVVGSTVYCSGQIGINPGTMELESTFESQAHQVFKNLDAVCKKAGGNLSCIVKINIFLSDINHFIPINQVMEQYFSDPYPARAVVAVMALPKGAFVEADAIMVLV